MDSVVVVIVVSGEGGKETQNNEAEPHYLWRPTEKESECVIIDSTYAKGMNM